MTNLTSAEAAAIVGGTAGAIVAFFYSLCYHFLHLGDYSQLENLQKSR